MALENLTEFNQALLDFTSEMHNDFVRRQFEAAVFLANRLSFYNSYVSTSDDSYWSTGKSEKNWQISVDDKNPPRSKERGEPLDSWQRGAERPCLVSGTDDVLQDLTDSEMRTHTGYKMGMESSQKQASTIWVYNISSRYAQSSKGFGFGTKVGFRPSGESYIDNFGNKQASNYGNFEYVQALVEGHSKKIPAGWFELSLQETRVEMLAQLWRAAKRKGYYP